MGGLLVRFGLMIEVFMDRIKIFSIFIFSSSIFITSCAVFLPNYTKNEEAKTIDHTSRSDFITGIIFPCALALS